MKSLSYGKHKTTHTRITSGHCNIDSATPKTLCDTHPAISEVLHLYLSIAYYDCTMFRWRVTLQTEKQQVLTLGMSGTGVSHRQSVLLLALSKSNRDDENYNVDDIRLLCLCFFSALYVCSLRFL